MYSLQYLTKGCIWNESCPSVSLATPLPRTGSCTMGGPETEAWGGWDWNEDRNGGSFQPCFDPGIKVLGWGDENDETVETSTVGLVWECGGVSSGTELSPSVLVLVSEGNTLELLEDGSEENSPWAGGTGWGGLEGVVLDTSGVDKDWTGLAGAREKGLPPS